MSFTDPAAEPVQPDPGQGGEGGGNPAYAEYLNRVPEDARGPAEEAFKAWDANYQRTSQEYADYRKGWEPYEQAGVNQFSPQDIQAAFDLLRSPEQARAWLDEQYGPLQAPDPQPQQTQVEDPYGFQDPAQQQLEQLLEQKLGPVQQQLERFQQWQQQLEQQALEGQIADQLNAEVAALKAEHAANLPEKVQEKFEHLIETFALPYAEQGSDPKVVVAKAWGDLQVLLNDTERATLQAKVNAPAPAEGGGVPDVTPPQAKSIMDPAVQAAAVEFLRANRAA